jgi:hypothetical protein
MITTVVLSLLAVLFVGIIATPGLGAIGLVLAPSIGAAVVWWTGAAAVTHGRPSDVVVRTRHRQFLGPGGPDDPFADEHVDEGSPR